VEELNTLIDLWKGKSSSFRVESDIELMMLRILVRTQFSENISLDYVQILKNQALALDETSIKTQKLDFFKNKMRKRLGLKKKDVVVSSPVEYLKEVANHVIAFSKENPDSCGYILGEMIKSDAPHSSMQDLILNLLFAGYDTTASALSWTLLALAQNPNEQEKIRAEIEDEEIRFSTISRFAYSKMVIQESMRLYPPVWSIHRQSTDAEDINGMVFPPNSYFMMCVYTMHRDPKHWEKPNEFYPNHFLADNFRGKAFQYIPFGQGERVCIGKPLAMTELQFIVPYLVQHFQFYSTESKEPRIRPGIIIKAKNGITLRVEKRD